MRFHKTGNIVFCSTERHDLDYIREAAEKVYAHYHGEGPQWQLSQSEQMWPLSFGGRASISMVESAV